MKMVIFTKQIPLNRFSNMCLYKFDLNKQYQHLLSFKSNMREKTIEETYQKKTPLQHILIRPDTYVGSIEMEKSFKWVLRENHLKLTYEQISFVPALYKIFDEVLVNAADNYQRDTKMNLLKVNINPTQGSVCVHNNGKGIPVEIHKDQKIYVPQLIFGHLLTGSNYNDDQKKVVGGRNGYGAKLANIFSHKFIVECGDGRLKKKFRMVWSKNMTVHGQADIQGYSGKDFTSVTFYPDFSRFGMRAFDDDIVSLMNKRVFDMAGLLNSVKVFLNEKEIPINSFIKYVDMYFPNTEEPIPKIRDDSVDTDRWQIIVSLSDGQFKQVSFVNGICTTKGGTHVNYITDQIVEKIQEKLQKKDKNLNVKPFQIKGHLWIFVKALIQNPAFDSQTKETLTLKQSMFGSKCVLSEKMIKQILKTGIIDQIYQEAKNKELLKLAKMTGGQKKAKLIGIPKLQDANEAGTRNSEKCTLILTQGDSAKSLAMAGLQVIGRDYYGVFPLKGKLLNARQATNSTIMKNEEIQNIIKIIGLQIGKTYEDLKCLRYGSIMIMSDQDTDGSHIKGLVINFIHAFWPSLFRWQGFLKQFITPLLKATKGRECFSFYTMKDFKTFAERQQNLKSWKVKYYKGLGTSTDKEAMQYFQQLQRCRIYFKYNGPVDDESMELIFSKKNAQKRKEWLSHYDANEVMVYDRNIIGYSQFVHKEFIHFSNEDNYRSISSIIDGFKPGQRKIIYACFKRNLKQEIKVAQLAGYVAEHSAYHHGEMSLTMTIVNMAQSFVGSNNINLLMPNGQFGSRNLGGKDHASARYIFTNLNRVTRLIYPEADDHSLVYMEDDGQLVQPQYYVPIIPMGLVNGCEGIGSGWSTYVPNYNPRDIAEMIMKRIKNNDAFTELDPWYKGFIGQINKKEDGNYEVKGIIEFDPEKDNIIHIKELPINKWTKDYKEYLDQIMTEGDTKIVGLRQYHTKNRVDFEIELNQEFANQHRDDIPYLFKFFKLTANISMKNMVGFNSTKRLFKYPSSIQIMEQFYIIRLQFYQKRKDYLVSRLVRDLQILTNKQRFIIEVVQQKLVIRNIKKIKIVQILKEKGYTKFSNFPQIKSTKLHLIKNENKEEGQQKGEQQSSKLDESKQYNYLLSMPLWNLTFQKVQQIKKSKAQKRDELCALQKTTITDLWMTDLMQFLKILDKVEQEEEEDRRKGEEKVKAITKGQKAKKKIQKKTGKDVKQKVKPEKKAINWDSDSQINTIADNTDTKTQSKIEGKPKAKKEGKGGQKSNKLPEKQSDDLISRVKRKMQQESKNKTVSANNTLTNFLAKPTNNKPKNTKNVYDKEDDDFVIVPVSKAKPQSQKKKKKMNIDSDEEESEWSDYQ